MATEILMAPAAVSAEEGVKVKRLPESPVAGAQAAMLVEAIGVVPSFRKTFRVSVGESPPGSEPAPVKGASTSTT